MFIDPYVDRWMERLKVPSDAIVYLLLDGVFLPGLVRMLSAAGLSTPPALLFENLPGCSEETRDVSPFVIRYDPDNSRLKNLISRCSGFPMLSAIETVESQADLAVRLAAWCIVETDGQRFNFRFPDTRRLPSIFDALTTRQKAELAGPATRWSYIDRNGSWSELPVPGIKSGIADRPALNPQQFAALVSASEVDEVIKILEDTGERMHGLHSQRYVVLSMALRISKKSNLNTNAKLDWCAECLRNGLASDVIEAAEQFAQWSSRAILAG